MLSYHRCIASTVASAEDTYINNLNLKGAQKEKLLSARRLIREALRAAFKSATANFAGDERPISPNFFTQGSWAYKTINRPTHLPPQQIDMDDGCYLPMTFVRGTNPKRAANWFFAIADGVLEALVANQGWKGYDKSKATCCRIILDNESHIDVPLYSIRDQQFVLMKSLGQERAGRVLEAAVTSEDEYTFDWSMVTEKDVLLAMRNGVWKPSNPMDVCKWALSAVDAKGNQLLEVWRAAKAWRDQQFPNGGGPSSICLMALIEPTFVEVSRRHDLAILEAAKIIRKNITKRVPAPWDAREDLNQLRSEEREVVSQKAAALEQALNESILGEIADSEKCLKRLATQFGKHFSKDVSRVDLVRAPEVVRSFSPAIASIPVFRGDNRSA